MIFACIKSGHYVFIEDNVVVAHIKRQLTTSKRNPKWTDTYYQVTWRFDGMPRESYRTLRCLGSQYRDRIENFAGYNNLLGDKWS